MATQPAAASPAGTGLARPLADPTQPAAASPAGTGLARLLADPTLPGLTLVVGGREGAAISRVFLAESLRDVEHAPPQSLVILSRAASNEAVDYRLDVAVRWASLRRAAALTTFNEGGLRRSITAVSLAQRSQLALVAVPQQADLGELIRAAGRVLDGDAQLALGRAEASLEALAAAEQAHLPPEQLAEAAGSGLGLAISERPPGPGDLGIALSQDPGAAAYSCPRSASWALATSAQLILHALAGAVARQEQHSRDQVSSQTRSRSDLLGELLVADQAHAVDLMGWARRLALPIDGWHVVVHLEPEEPAPGERDQLARLALLARAAEDALQTAMSSGGDWFLARATGMILLVHTSTADPGPQSGTLDLKVARAALAGLRAHFPSVRFRAGIGAAHEGVAGLRASALEAKAALLAVGRRGRSGPDAVAFDAVGIRRMLLEWYASETSREAVRVQLEPLERLGSPRSDTAIRTLQTYLDQQGSVVRTAAVLHLHRNAVSYRLQRIFELLEVDPSDPDQRLALQLACRARLMW